MSNTEAFERHITINDVGDIGCKLYPNIIYLPSEGSLKDMRSAHRAYLPPEEEHPIRCSVENSWKELSIRPVTAEGHQETYTAVAFRTKPPFGSLQPNGSVFLLWSNARREWFAITRDWGYIRDDRETVEYKGAYAPDAHCEEILHRVFHVSQHVDDIVHVPPEDLVADTNK